MYRQILVPVDLNEPSSWQKALPVAIELAQSHDAELHVVNVVPDFGMSVVGSFFPGDFEKKAIAEAGEAMSKFVSEIVPEGIKANPIVVSGNIYQEIMSAADRIGADLIVMAAHRPELKDYLLGPNAARVVRHADQSVLIVR